MHLRNVYREECLLNLPLCGEEMPEKNPDSNCNENPKLLCLSNGFEDTVMFIMFTVTAVSSGSTVTLPCCH